MARSTVLDFYIENATQHGDKVAALVKRDGKYQQQTWRGLHGESLKVAAGLHSLGVQVGDRVNIVSNTRVEWVTVDMGILMAGAVTVPIYPSSIPDECQYIVDNCGAQVIFAEDATQVGKFLAERARLPHVRKIIQMTGAVSDSASGLVIAYDEFVKAGKLDEAELERRRASISKDSPVIIIYTSGTTGRPKGVVLTHDNLLYEAEAIQGIGLMGESDVQLFFLPLAHSFGQCLIAGWFACRHVMAFAENMTTIRENLAEVKPTVMAAVPRVFEKFYAAVAAKGTAAGGLKATLFNVASDLSARNGENERSGRALGLRDSLKWALLKKVIFKKVGVGLNELLGGRMRAMISGGAPLSPKINFFFRDAGVIILEGYGLTETSAAASINRPQSNRIGTVGVPMPGCEFKIASDGEILIRGRNVMKGYWNNPGATAEVLKDGWLHTGDIGVLDSDGSCRITDRKKDIIVTAGGKNVAPQNLENMLKTHKLISQAVIHGDKRKFLTALITIDADALKQVAAEKNLSGGSVTDMVKHPEIEQIVQGYIDLTNSKLPSYETIKRFKILDTDFSIESGELTPSLKVKRKVVNERYKQLFEQMYEGASGD